MTARAESILSAVKTLVTGLTTTGTNVVRGRIWPTDDTASLSVDMGAEEPAADPNMKFQDEWLDVIITARVKAAEGQTDTQLNKIHAEVYAALMGSPTLSLAYVFRVKWSGRGKPALDHAEKAVAMQELRYRVHYRHSLTSAEA